MTTPTIYICVDNGRLQAVHVTRQVNVIVFEEDSSTLHGVQGSSALALTGGLHCPNAESDAWIAEVLLEQGEMLLGLNSALP